LAQIVPDNALFTVLGSIAGSALATRIVNHFLDKRKNDEELDAKMRDELRKELDSLYSRLDSSNKACDEWRDKYYKLRDLFYNRPGDGPK
jgi:hypothetical protein